MTCYIELNNVMPCGAEVLSLMVLQFPASLYFCNKNSLVLWLFLIFRQQKRSHYRIILSDYCWSFRRAGHSEVVITVASWTLRLNKIYFIFVSVYCLSIKNQALSTCLSNCLTPESPATCCLSKISLIFSSRLNFLARCSLSYFST